MVFALPILLIVRVRNSTRPTYAPGIAFDSVYFTFVVSYFHLTCIFLVLQRKFIEITSIVFGAVEAVIKNWCYSLLGLFYSIFLAWQI